MKAIIIVGQKPNIWKDAASASDMNNQPFILPKPVGGMLSLLPGYPRTLLFARAVNLVLGDTLRSEVMRPLLGKLICLQVTDAGMAFYCTFDRHGMVACRHTREPDLTIAACACDLLMLALRKEDPDTLFFGRRLRMEGDTELGLLVKNTLDALDLPPLDLRSLSPAKILAEIKDAVAGLR